MYRPIHLFLLLLVVCTSCQSQTKPTDMSSGAGSLDKSIPEDIPKKQVATVDLLEWKSIGSIEVHRASWHRDYTKPEYKKQEEMELIRSLGSFSIINNGTIYAKSSNLHFFSRDHGKNWYEFEAFSDNGQPLFNNLVYFDLYRTPEFFVLQAREGSEEPINDGVANEEYSYFTSYNGSVWKKVSKDEFNFDDYNTIGRGRFNNLLFKKANPESFDELNRTYPNNYHTIIYDLGEVTATIYPYKDEKYILPKELHYGFKWMYRLCDGTFVHPRRNYPYVEKGTSLLKLDKITYELEDSIQLADGKNSINNSGFFEFGCHIVTDLTVKDEWGYRTILLAVLSNDPATPSKLELMADKPINVFSSQNGKYMIANNGWPMINKNRLACGCRD